MELDSHPIAETKSLAESVPIVDISKLATKNNGPTIAAIAKASSEWGFFQIVNHGISSVLVSEVLDLTKQFFAAPVDSKSEVRRGQDNPWGYYNSELTKNKRDKKEIFDFTLDGVDPIYHARNQWPSFDAEFERVMRQYFDECARVCLRLVDAYSVGLGLPPDALRSLFEPLHTGFMRLNYYPVKDPLAGQDEEIETPEADLGVHHHTDAGALTLLLQHEVSGLQVHKDGMWHNIPPLGGAFVVNTGDMMQVLSNDIYVAAVHRVLAMDSVDRFSIPLFLNPSADAIIQPGEATIKHREGPRYAPISWSDFRRKRSDGDYSDYGAEVQISHFRT